MRRRARLRLVLVLLFARWGSPFAFGPQAPPQSAEGPKVDAKSEKPAVQLLGREAWRFNVWRAETDDVRGGQSQASFLGLTDESGHAEFLGQLEADKDAFAGVSLQASQLPEALCELKGLVLHLEEADGKEYAVALRMLGAPAGVEHVFRFKAEGKSRVEMFFRDFKPTLRGKETEDVQPALALERVQSITLQTRRSFDNSAGPFSLVLKQLEGLVGRELPPPPKPARETKWTCSACGTMNFGIARYCERCGESRNAEEDRARRARAEAERYAQKKWECAGCGQKNFPTSEECFKCGAPRA